MGTPQLQVLGWLSRVPLPHAAAGCFNILINGGRFALRAAQPNAHCTLEPGGRHRMLGCRLPWEPRDVLRANKPLRRLLSPKLSPVFSPPRANSTTNTHVSAARARLGGGGSMGGRGRIGNGNGVKWVGDAPEDGAVQGWTLGLGVWRRSSRFLPTHSILRRSEHPLC